MKAPALTGAGVKQAALGLAVLAGLVVVYKLYRLIAGGAQAISQATTAAGEAVGGGVYTLLNGDANAQVQSVFQQEMAALKAVGNPPVGSDAYNRVLAQYNGG